MVVAIRTARWGATGTPDPLCSDVDPAPDREVEFALRITERVFHSLLRRNPTWFPQKGTPIFKPDEESPA